jgi:hypothetical protein
MSDMFLSLKSISRSPFQCCLLLSTDEAYSDEVSVSDGGEIVTIQYNDRWTDVADPWVLLSNIERLG